MIQPRSFRVTSGANAEQVSYVHLLANGNGISEGTEGSVRNLTLVNLTLRNLKIKLSAAPGTGASWSITVRVDGVDVSDVMVIADDATETEYLPDITMEEGQWCNLKFEPSTGVVPNDVNQLEICFETETATPGLQIYCAASNIGSASGATHRYHGLFSPDGFYTDEDRGVSIAAIDGIITKYGIAAVTNAGSQIHTFVLVKNGIVQDGTGGTVNTTSVFTPPGLSDVIEISDDFSLPFVKGDRLSMRSTRTSGGMIDASVCVKVVGTIDGFSQWCSNVAALTGVGPLHPILLNPAGLGAPSVESSSTVRGCVTPFTLGYGFFGRFDQDPGDGVGWDFRVRKNFGNANPTFDIVGNGSDNVTGQDLVNAVEVEEDDVVNIIATRVGVTAEDMLFQHAIAVYVGCVAPDLAGLTIAEAEELIEEYGYVIGSTTYAYDDTVPEGSVISQSIESQGFTVCGLEMDLVISLGPEPPIVVDPPDPPDDPDEPPDDIVLTAGRPNRDRIPPAGDVDANTICELVARRLEGNLSHRIWSAEEIDRYLDQGLRELLTRTNLLWDWTYLENLPQGFTYNHSWEREYATDQLEFIYYPGDGMSGGQANFNHEWERRYVLESVREEDFRAGPANHTSPDDVLFMDEVAFLEIPAVTDLPYRLTVLERGAWDKSTIAATSHRFAKDHSRYETEKGEVHSFSWAKDGPRAFRKIRVPAAIADVYTYDGTWGIPRDVTDLEFVGEDMEVVGTWGIVRQTPGEHPIGPFKNYYIWGTPRRFYRDGNNVKVEHWRISEFSCLDSELPTRYTTYLVYYAMYKALWRKGPGQDIKLASWYLGRWTDAIERTLRRISRQNKERTGRLGGNDPGGRPGPPRPRLPWQYGKLIR